jgi:hypothetical protein
MFLQINCTTPSFIIGYETSMAKMTPGTLGSMLSRQ